MSTIVWQFEHSLALPFFGTGMKMDLFQYCGHCRVFQICWTIECSTLTASSFRIWTASAGISTPPLALFVVLLPMAHLTSHSKMSGSRWITTPLWSSRSWRPFLNSSSVYSCHLFVISSASVRSLTFQSFIMPIIAWNVPLVSLIFLKSSLVFPILLFSSISLLLLSRFSRVRLFTTPWTATYQAPPSMGFSRQESLQCSLNKASSSLLAILWNSAFRLVYLSLSPLLLFSAICKPSSDNHFALLHFFLLGMVLVTISCTMLRTCVHSSSGTLWDLIPWIYLSLPLRVIRDLI